MRDDDLSLLEELVGDADAFTEQAAGVAAEVEDQSLEIAEGIERVGDFMLGGLIETVDVHVADAGLDQEMYVNAVARNLVADEREFHGLFNLLTRDADVDGGALRSLQ